MRTSVAITALAALVGLTSPAQAAQLLSPPFPTSLKTAGACRILNTGTTPVAVRVSLFSNNGLIVSLDLCNGAPLAAGHTCLVMVDDLPDDSYAACSVTATNVTKLRGTFELFEAGTHDSRVFVAEELR
jgi:hypothetical protein